MSIAHNLQQTEATVQIRRIRNQPFFWLPNTVYDDYSAMLGLEGLGLYAALARYASNTTAQCWPSLARLSRELGCTQKTLRVHLDRLVSTGLIALEESPGKPTIITLCDPGKNHHGPPPPARATETPTPVKKTPASSNNTNNTQTRSCSSSWYDKEKEEARARETCVPPPPPPAPVPPEGRPDDVLAALGLTQDEQVALMAVAEAELRREGTNPFRLILPMKQARMIEIRLREGVPPPARAGAA